MVGAAVTQRGNMCLGDFSGGGCLSIIFLMGKAVYSVRPAEIMTGTSDLGGDKDGA